MTTPIYYNQLHAIKKLNEQGITISPATFWIYVKEGIIQPDIIYLFGKRELPGFTEDTIAKIVIKLQNARSQTRTPRGYWKRSSHWKKPTNG